MKQPRAGLLRHGYLVRQLVRRDVLLKYRGSWLGIGWSFLHPLLLLAVLTAVFSGLVGHRFGHGGGSTGFGHMALFIYCGLVVFMPVAEIAAVAPRLLHSNQVYVKKIVFPTEMLPLVAVITATVHGAVNLLILVAAAIFAGAPISGALLVPILLLPVWLFALGCAWFLAAAGCFVRDLAHVMPVLTQLLLFLTPVFYSPDNAPEWLVGVNRFNPLATTIMDLRAVLVLDTVPRWGAFLPNLVLGTAVAAAGYALFRRGKEEFADVL